MKKRKRRDNFIPDMMGTTFLAAGGSIALGGLGGSVATSGQRGLSNATSYHPTMGTMYGIGKLFKTLKPLKKQIKY